MAIIISFLYVTETYYRIFAVENDVCNMHSSYTKACKRFCGVIGPWVKNNNNRKKCVVFYRDAQNFFTPLQSTGEK